MRQDAALQFRSRRGATPGTLAPDGPLEGVKPCVQARRSARINGMKTRVGVVPKLATEEMGSRYLSIVLHVLLDNAPSRGDYQVHRPKNR